MNNFERISWLKAEIIELKKLESVGGISAIGISEKIIEHEKELLHLQKIENGSYEIPSICYSKIIRVGRKLYAFCSKCRSLVRLNKPIIGSLHFYD